MSWRSKRQVCRKVRCHDTLNGVTKEGTEVILAVPLASPGADIMLLILLAPQTLMCPEDALFKLRRDNVQQGQTHNESNPLHVELDLGEASFR